MYRTAEVLCVSEKLWRLLHFKAVFLSLLWLFLGKQIPQVKGLTPIGTFCFLCPSKIMPFFIACEKKQISFVCDICHSHNYYCDKIPPYSNILLWDLKLLIQAKSYDGLFLTSFFIKASETELGPTSMLLILYIKYYYTSLWS